MMRTGRTIRWARVAVFLALLAPVPVARTAAAQDAPTSERAYVVRAGDTLYGIARRFETTVDAIKRANGLAGDGIEIGQTLVLPVHEPVIANPDVEAVPKAVTSDSAKTQREPAAESADSSVTAVPDTIPLPADLDLGYIQVGRGQSVYDVAMATGLPVDSLLKLNPGIGAFLPDSSRLVVPQEFASVNYTVKPGDTLYRIARQMGTTISTIRAANRIQGDVIHVGQRLTVPSARLAARQPGALPVIAEGEVRAYPDRFVGRLTASGRPYDPEAYVVSHRDLPIGSIVLVSIPGADRRTFAEVADRLPGSAQYLMDASEAVMRALRTGAETALRVELRVLRYGQDRQ